MRRNGFIKMLLFIAVIVTASRSVSADVKPHALFSSGMVLQRDVETTVWGFADKGEKIIVRMMDQEVQTVCRDGRWSVRLKPMKAGGPVTMTISGRNTVTIDDVLIGDVWVCSGQSNMQWPVRQSANAEQEIAQADHPTIRLFQVPMVPADVAPQDLNAAWMRCTPQTIPDFTAVGYFFGRDLNRELAVPIGLINASWGGSPAQAWTSRTMLMSKPETKVIMEEYDKIIPNYPQIKADYEKRLAEWKAQAEQAKKEGRNPGWAPGLPMGPEHHFRPGALYNGMIVAIQPFAIKGAIWYQGESNAGAYDQYRVLFPLMITTWRQDWWLGDFPFLFVQLAPFSCGAPGDCSWAGLREAQADTLSLANTGMAVITDVGEERDIHPRKKQEVGHRLALAALRIAYGKDVVHCGPTYESMTVQGDKAIISFKNVGSGLVIGNASVPTENKLVGFIIAGQDGVFYNADAVIQGDKVVVSSPKVSNPAAVRYGWANWCVCNLANKEGLPASPFRTDRSGPVNCKMGE